uniref:L-aspartate dehydrogenase n=1 Tax=Caulobacter sp. (strain K31) TaxID=366602 RepID=B0T924_CAUSK
MERRVALIGLGTIGASVAAQWRLRPPRDMRLAAVCVRPGRAQAARAALPAGVAIVTQVEDLIALAPDIVIETAGHAGLEAWGETALACRAALYVLSVGALADEALRAKLVDAAARHGGQICVPAGALAGFDGLRSLARSGLEWARYTSTKPPAAWRDTPAEALIDLNTLSVPTVIFEGSAARAAQLYPRNANLAAAVALAGLGFDQTEVRLVADPAALGNSALIEARGGGARLRAELAGEASPDNPKTSAIVAHSVLAALDNETAIVRFA